MANDTPQQPNTKEAPAVSTPEKPAPGQVGPNPEKAPAKAVPFEKAKAPAPEVSAAALAEKNAALEKEQAAFLREMDARADFITDKKPEKAKAPKQKPAPAKKAPVKDTAKKQPAAAQKAPADKDKAAPEEKKVDKAAIEKELREKFGIPKSEKPVAAWVPPETETVEKLAHSQLRPFNGHPFNVDTKAPKFMALTVSIRTHGITQPIIARPAPGGKGKLEIVSGHRRQAAALAAGPDTVPVIVRALNNDQAIQQMVEDNVNNRESARWSLPRR